MGLDLRGLDLARWRVISDDERAALAEDAARRAGGRVVGIAGGELAVATIEVAGCAMVLIPGGRARLGWDGGEVALDGDARRAWEADAGGGPFERMLRPYLAPAREVELAPFLLEIEPRDVNEVAELEDVDDVEGAVRNAITAEGFRLVGNDEWEHAVRAGSTSLFRWGDAWPSGIPYGERTTFTGHLTPSALGLALLDDPYDVELVAEPDALRGGDGGTALCGGRPWPEPWYSFASAFVWPRACWDDVVIETFEQAFVRRARSLI
ncbi:MAG: hypothetical protein H6708_02815 [Kofleriaceae bacterium]|nr:hypothetical protein [Myxococcales bacterium]MCB9559323.1 hypothetical protein [Kofleriaceae bacterium]